MVRFATPFLAMPLLGLAVSGCQPSAQILAPPHPVSGSDYSTPGDPVMSFEVKFANDYQGNFSATLDGQDWTSQFTPPAAPNGISTAPSPPIFSGGQPEIINGRIVPNSWSHVLDVTVDCPWPCNRGDTVRFAPPQLDFRPGQGQISMRRFQTINMDVEVPVAHSVPITVQLTPNGALSLNNQPIGQPISVTIPTNDTRAFFTATAMVQSNAVIGAEAPGCESGSVGFTVSPP
jgi:hypothetical protein